MRVFSPSSQSSQTVGFDGSSIRTAILKSLYRGSTLTVTRIGKSRNFNARLDPDLLSAVKRAVAAGDFEDTTAAVQFGLHLAIQHNRLNKVIQVTPELAADVQELIDRGVFKDANDAVQIGLTLAVLYIRLQMSAVQTYNAGQGNNTRRDGVLNGQRGSLRIASANGRDHGPDRDPPRDR